MAAGLAAQAARELEAKAHPGDLGAVMDTLELVRAVCVCVW